MSKDSGEGAQVLRSITIATAALVLASAAGAAGPITGKVRGVFNRAGLHGFMLGGENLRRYVKTPPQYVWCAWQDGKVLVHVRISDVSPSPCQPPRAIR